jgi:hypothetical protein
MTCTYCEKRATGLDLCHERLPVCDLHQELGHQIGELPPEPPPEVTPSKESRWRHKE